MNGWMDEWMDDDDEDDEHHLISGNLNGSTQFETTK
jgi:hypothetical protein